MCRFLVYKGSDSILLSKLILDPSHSILTQSFDARLRLDHGRNNADGFGIAFYTDASLGPEPCIFTSTTPAWNCANLHRLASKTASRLIFAHVRATTEGSLSEDNCHPFTHGCLTFMHNGGLGGWKYIKRRLGERLADKWYLGVQGGTDSEWAFALFMDTLERIGHNPSSTPPEGFGPNVLRKAVLQTIKQINDFIDDIPESIRQDGKVDTRSLLNFAVTDGHSVICTRYVSSCTDEAASLYYSSGTSWNEKVKNNFQMDRRDKGADIVLVASEPLTFERDNWVTVPTNSTLTIHKQTVMVHPIIDQYYSHNPYHHRSSRFVVEKGLITNEKSGANGTSRTPGTQSPLPTPSLKDELKRIIPFQSSRLSSVQTPSDQTPIRGVTPEMMDSSPESPSANLEQTQHVETTINSNGDYAKSREERNTKKKRRTLLEEIQGDNNDNSQQWTETALSMGARRRETMEDERTGESGNTAKIAQYFPELG